MVKYPAGPWTSNPGPFPEFTSPSIWRHICFLETNLSFFYLGQVLQDGLSEALAQLELVQVLQLELEAPLLEEEGLNDVASLEANSLSEC